MTDFASLPIAQMVPPNTWRVVGDRDDRPETYIPLDGSPQSREMLAKSLRRLGHERAAPAVTPYRCGLPVAMIMLAAGSAALAAGTATLITLAAKALLARH